MWSSRAVRGPQQTAGHGNNEATRSNMVCGGVRERSLTNPWSACTPTQGFPQVPSPPGGLVCLDTDFCFVINAVWVHLGWCSTTMQSVPKVRMLLYNKGTIFLYGAPSHGTVFFSDKSLFCFRLAAFDPLSILLSQKAG